MNVLTELEETLKNEIKTAILETGLANEEDIPEIILEKPKEKAHGDFAANIAMQLARVAKMAPRKIAEQIVEKIDTEKANVEKIEIAGPGFINFRLTHAAHQAVLSHVFAEGAAFGDQSDNGDKLMVEFVSANPTGPLHVGHARQAALGEDRKSTRLNSSHR